MSRAIAALLLALLSMPLASANVPPLSAVITAGSPDLRLLGEGRMRWFGLHLYDAALWVSGAEFFPLGRSTGAIRDPEFARVFFSIWLDPRTREPKLRAALLGRK